MEWRGERDQEADVTSFFDTVNRPTLLRMLRERIADKSLLRLIAKSLHVDVLEGGSFSRPDEGTVQGSIISPLLGNLYLHHALDLWFEELVKPRLRRKAALIHYADDFLIGFEHPDDARRLLTVLGKRLGRFNLKLHPDKTSISRLLTVTKRYAWFSA
ncbi:MAG: reverse transcriptase/maturase family protein [bacterium]